MKYLGKIQDNKDLVTKEYVDNAVSATRHVATYSNTNGSNTGKYYKISINSYTSWMLLFKIYAYHQYESYEFAVSGYNYGASHWYSPAVMMITSSYYRTIDFTFGYDSDWHLWVAFPAAQYSGIAVSLEANGYTQVADEKNLFTIELVEGIPETVQTTKSCVRPWYRNETVSNATTAATATLAADAGDQSMKVHPQSQNEVNFGGTSNSDTIYMGYRARDSKPIPAKFVFGGPSGTATIQAATFTGNVNGTAANVTGVVASANGGTGKTNLNDAANALINGLSTGSSDPTDNDYYVSQYAGGGTTTTTYHRRPVSALWNYIKGKISSVLGLTATQYGGNAATATNASKVNNLTVQTAVPANAKFTDTVTTATTSGSGNAVTAVTASNGALTVTKGTTFLTSHQDISGKADKSATVSTVTWDSTNKKLTKTINGTTSDVVTAATLRTGLNVADGAEVNQNAFSNVKVGSTTVAADSKTDTLELVAGSNVTLTPDATNDKVTIAATDTTYESKAAASGGTAVSLVTTGEKYTWNHKMSSIADVTNMELLTYEGTTNDVMTVGLHDDDATSKIPVVNATTGKIPASVYNNTTYESKEAASGGTAVSLVTTGEKYTWNNKSSLALGETSSTAYRGDRGKTAYDHSQATHARTDATAVAASTTNGNIKINGSETTVYTHPSGTNPHGTTKSDVGLGNVGNFKAVSTVASQGLTDTEKSNARTNIGAGTSSLTLGTSGTTAAYGNHNHTGVYSPVGHTHDGINIDIDNGGSYIPVSNIEAGDNVTLDYNNQNDTLTINATGGGGTSNYNSLSNRPQINGTTLTGNKTSSDLGLQSALSTSPPTPTVSATKGTKVSAEMRKYGNIIQFTLTFKNTSSVGSGSNVFEGTLSTNKPLQTISACGYYSSNALPMSINSSGSIVVRNAGSAAVTCSSNTTIGATWLV